MVLKLTEKDGAVYFGVRVIVRASKSEIAGEHEGSVKVRIAVPPVDGAANAELIRLLAKEFGISKNRIEIAGGHRARSKQILIRGLNVADVNDVLKAKT
jgi:uncharacterized protein (TIGR00251 family)